MLVYFTFYNAIMNSQRRNETEFGLKEQKGIGKVFFVNFVILIKYLEESIIIKFIKYLLTLISRL